MSFLRQIGIVMGWTVVLVVASSRCRYAPQAKDTAFSSIGPPRLLRTEFVCRRYAGRGDRGARPRRGGNSGAAGAKAWTLSMKSSRRPEGPKRSGSSPISPYIRERGMRMCR